MRLIALPTSTVLYSPGEYDEKMTLISISLLLLSLARSENSCSRPPKKGPLNLGSYFLDMSSYNKPIADCHPIICLPR